MDPSESDFQDPVTEDVANPFAGLTLDELKAKAVELQSAGEAELAKDAPDLAVLSNIEMQLNQLASARDELQYRDDEIARIAERLPTLASVVTASAEPEVTEPVAEPVEAASEPAEAPTDIPVVEPEATTDEVIADEQIEPEPSEEPGNEERSTEPTTDTAQAEEGEPEMNEDEIVDVPTADAIAAELDPQTAEVVTASAPAIAPKVQVGYVAATTSPAVQFGAPINAEGFASAASAILPSGSHRPIVAKTVIASMPAFEQFSHVDGVELLSNANGVAATDAQIAKIFEGRRAGVVTASLCDPLEVIREVQDCGSTETPFRNIFERRPMARGGFTFTPAGGAAATIWTEANQAAVDPSDDSTWKPCTPVDCVEPVKVVADEVVGCISFDDTTEWSAPESIAQRWSRTRVEMARASEIQLMTKFDADALASAGAFSATNSTNYAAVPFTKENLAEALSSITYGVRTGGEDYVIALGEWFVRFLASNESGQAFGNCAADVLACLSDLTGQAVVPVKDATGAGSDDAPAATLPNQVNALTTAPKNFRVRLVPATSMFIGETGYEEYGVERSPQLRRQNRAQMFGREYHALVRPGCAIPAYVDLDAMCLRGGRLGTITPGC